MKKAILIALRARGGMPRRLAERRSRHRSRAARRRRLANTISHLAQRRRPQLRDRLGGPARSRRQRLHATRQGTERTALRSAADRRLRSQRRWRRRHGHPRQRQCRCRPRVRGGPGDDRLTGGAGADKLIGGPGDDRLDRPPRQRLAARRARRRRPHRRPRRRPAARRARHATSLAAAPATNAFSSRGRASAAGSAATSPPPEQRGRRRSSSAISRPTSESAASSRKPAWMPSTKGGSCAGEDGRRQAEADRAAGDLEHVDDPAGEAGLRFVDRGHPGGRRGRVEAADPDPEDDHARRPASRSRSPRRPARRGTARR